MPRYLSPRERALCPVEYEAGWTQIFSEPFIGEENILSALDVKKRFLGPVALSLVTIPTTPPQLHILVL